MVSILYLKHSTVAPSHSEPKFLQWPGRLLYHLVTKFKPHCPPNHSLNIPNIYLPYGLRFHLPGTFFQQIFSWFYIVHICVKYKLAQSFQREVHVCMRCLKIVTLSESSSILLRIPPKEITHYIRKDL